MYIAIDNDNKIIHTNRAPIKQNLSAKEVYHKYDSKIHTIAKFAGTQLPEFWKVVNSFVVEKTLQEKINDGNIELDEGTIYDDKEKKIRAMTDVEKVKAGLITQASLDAATAEAERETLIQEKIREQAITSLIAEGKING